MKTATVDGPRHSHRRRRRRTLQNCGYGLHKKPQNRYKTQKQTKRQTIGRTDRQSDEREPTTNR